MSDKISALPAVSYAAITDADLFPLVNAGQTSRVTLADLRIAIGASGATLPAGRNSPTLTAYIAENAVFNVKNFAAGAAIDNGVLDAAPAFNAAIAAAVAWGGPAIVYAPYPAVAYRFLTTHAALAGLSHIDFAGDKAKITLDAAVKFAFKFTGTSADVSIHGFHIVGTGVATDMQTGIGTVDASSPAGTDIWINDNTIELVARGCFFDNSSLDSWRNVWVERNIFRDIKGVDGSTAPHPGYGIVNSGGSGFHINFNTLERCGRHAIYQSAGKGNELIGNRIRDHRLGYGVGFGAAIVISRSADILAAFNLMENCKDGGMTVEPRESSLPTTLADASRDIVLSGNIFRETNGIDIFVGSSAPDVSAILTGVLIQGSRIWRKTGATDTTTPILVMSGRGIRIKDTYIFAENAYTVQFSAIYFSAAVAATHTDDITVEGLELHASNGTSGSVFGVEVAASLCGGTSTIDLFDNKVRASAGVNSNPYAFDATVTNPNLAVRNPRHSQTVAYAASMIINVDRGDTALITATNGTAFAIDAGNTFGSDNSTSGQPLTVEIANGSGGALGVVTWAAKFKLAGAWVQPLNGKSRTITFRRRPATAEYVETSRAAADI